MDKLVEHGAIEFEMIYNVPNQAFEVVKMHKCSDRSDLGEANFTAAEAVTGSDGKREARGGSPPARPTAAAARPQPASFGGVAKSRPGQA